MKKRRILPTAYSQQKIKRAHIHATTYTHSNIELMDKADVDESKVATQMEIDRKMRSMQGLFIDLDDDEVDDLQDIIAMDDEMDIEQDEHITFVEMGTKFPEPMSSKIDFEASQVVPMNNNENSPPIDVPLALRTHSPETPSPSIIQNNMPVAALHAWTTHNGPTANVANIVDENNISSYLNVMPYHFEGKCVIVSIFQSVQTTYSFILNK